MSGPTRRAARGVVLTGAAAVLVMLAAGLAFADPSAPPSPTPSLSSPSASNPGIYGPLVGGGTMAPPPIVGPGLAPPGGSDPSWWDVPGQIEQAIDSWFGNLVKSALEPVLRLIGNTLLSSPDVSDGRIAQVWTGVLITANTLYVLFFLAGAVIVMGHETVQTRYSVKTIAPRLVLGMVASNASLWAIEQTVSLGNALAAALTGGKLSAEGIGSRLTSLIIDKLFLPSGVTQLFLVLLGGAVAVMGIVLLITCLIRAAVLLTLTAGAPLALACHALPQTEGLAKLWWRAIIGCLITQVAQALVLITCMQVFFDPNADTILGLPSGGGLVDMLLCLVLLFLLIKIPIWVVRIVLGRRPFGATWFGYAVKSAVLLKGMQLAGGHLRGRPTRHHALKTWRPGPPSPGSGLASFQGPRPRPDGGGGPGGWRPSPPTVTVTRVDPEPPPGTAAFRADGPRPPRPNGPPSPAPLGPVRRAPLALPVGSTVRRDRAHQAFIAAPPERGTQHGLFGPIAKTAPAGPHVSAAPSAPPRPRSGLKHEPAFGNPAPHKRAPAPKPTPLPLAPVFLAPADHKPKRTRRTPPTPGNPPMEES